METELVGARRGGAGLPDLLAGLADSVARNYLQRVVGGHTIGRNVVFQGGVASNGAVVAAFGRLLGRPVSVHPFNGLSGAIGAALLVRDAIGSAPTTFRGLGAIGPHQAKTFECRACENLCQVTQVAVGGAQVYFGDICERFSMNDPGRATRTPSTPDLFADRAALWHASLQSACPGPRRARGVVGLPRASGLHEFLPFWAAFFGQLGFEVLLSPPTSLRTLELGTRHLPAETCLPIKLAFGHVAALRPLGADAVFMPSPVRLQDPSGRPAYGCPYTQAVPFLIHAAMPDRILAPEVSYAGGYDEFSEAMADSANALGIEPSEMEGAFEAARAAQAAFHRRLQEEGSEALSTGFESALVVLGRPYNLFDPFLNLNLARHLSRMGVLAFPQGCLPVDSVDLGATGHDLPWHFPREAMRTALWAARDPRLHLVLVTNFGCGPDAFLQKHLAAVTPDRPPLVLEFDEHRGEAGMVTRLEAFLDQVAQRRRAPRAPSAVAVPDVAPSRLAGRRVFVPVFSDHAHALVGALRWIGAKAELLPPPGEQTRRVGEAAVSGKECHAYAMLMGDLVRLAERRRNGAPATFFYPGTSVPCLLSQFAEGFRMDLERRGLRGVEVLGPSMDGLVEALGVDGASQFWRGLVAADLLVRWLCGHRPYERTPGTADRVHQENLLDLADSLAVDDMARFLERAVSRMESVPIDRSHPRPLIGVAGDLYTRVSDAANLDLWRKLEAMGCEVWPAPFLVDSVEFGLPHEFAASLRAGRYRDALVAGLMILRKDLNAWRIRRRFMPLLERFGEPGHAEVLELAAPYLGPGSPGPLLLNVAKMVDFARRGADGVVHAMCLNCMLGTAASALIDRIRRDHGGIPIANLVYAGSDTAALRTKLETFVYQARAFREARIGRAVAGCRP